MDTYMMVRNTGDNDHHLTLNGWTGEALCGSKPLMREIGWTLGKTGSSEGLTICEWCREANAERVMATVR